MAPHLSLLLSLAAGILGRGGDSEDAVQETLLRLFKKIPPVKDAREMRAYLCRLTINEARRIRVTRWFRLSRSAEPLTDAVVPFDASVDQERATHYARLVDAVASLVDRLTPRERQVFLLRAFEDLDYEEIAGILKVRPVTCRRLYQLARERMTDLLREAGIRMEFPG